MHTRNSIINLPLLGGLTLSIAIHAAALYGKGLHRSAQPQLETGKTVVQLTLIPALSSRAVPADPPPQELKSPPKPVVQEPTPTPEPMIESSPQPKPAAIESVEQNASLQKDKGIITEAFPTEGIRATYPRISQRRKEEGTVILSIEVRSNGTAGEVKIVKSSGHRRLDTAALKAAKQTHYTAAIQWGRPVDSALIQPLIFELTHPD